MNEGRVLTLYHGTPGSRARDIISTGRISCSAESMMKVYDELKTTSGFVYPIKESYLLSLMTTRH
ncbi:hypothetical protein J2067_005185 [Erwinia rhapontici]|nr:hypothetical protein [Erwinia rhapontici]